MAVLFNKSDAAGRPRRNTFQPLNGDYITLARVAPAGLVRLVRLWSGHMGGSWLALAASCGDRAECLGDQEDYRNALPPVAGARNIGIAGAPLRRKQIS